MINADRPPTFRRMYYADLISVNRPTFGHWEWFYSRCYVADFPFTNQHRRHFFVKSGLQIMSSLRECISYIERWKKLNEKLSPLRDVDISSGTQRIIQGILVLRPDQRLTGKIFTLKASEEFYVKYVTD